MHYIERRVRAAVNPASTAVTGWWCHSVLRHALTGYGPAAAQRRLLRRGMPRAGRPSAEVMKGRAASIDELMALDPSDR